MKLLRLFSTALLCWNTLGILVLLWRYRVSQYGKSSHIVPIDGRVTMEETYEHQSKQSVEVPLKLNVQPLEMGDWKFREDYLNVPNIYLNISRGARHLRQTRMLHGRSVLFPQLQDIKFNNIYWQTFTGQQATYFLYNAYYDNREHDSTGRNWVRVISMVDMLPPPPVKCALWFDSGQHMLWATKVIIEHLWHKGWGATKNGTLHPYLISCLLPMVVRRRTGTLRSRIINDVPQMVSILHPHQRKPTTNLKVHYNHSLDNKKNFAVCVKGLEFPSQDLTIRLLEWFHLLRILGADMVFVYELDVHPKVRRLLDHLQSKGMVKAIPLTLPGYQPNFPQLRDLFLHKMVNNKRLNEIIPYNDCLYRNIYSYNFILLLDIDEVIIPLRTDSWAGLLNQTLMDIKLHRENDYKPSSYNARNVYFFDDLEYHGREMDQVPQYLHMCRHVIRSARFSKRGHYVKCFHDTARVKALHNHFPFLCLSGFHPCVSHDMSFDSAELQHYRPDCHDMNMTACEEQFKRNTILDFSIWRFMKKLLNYVLEDLTLLQLI